MSAMHQEPKSSLASGTRMLGVLPLFSSSPIANTKSKFIAKSRLNIRTADREFVFSVAEEGHKLEGRLLTARGGQAPPDTVADRAPSATDPTSVLDGLARLRDHHFGGRVQREEGRDSAASIRAARMGRDQAEWQRRRDPGGQRQRRPEGSGRRAVRQHEDG